MIASPDCRNVVGPFGYGRLFFAHVAFTFNIIKIILILFARFSRILRRLYIVFFSPFANYTQFIALNSPFFHYLFSTLHRLHSSFFFFFLFLFHFYSQFTIFDQIIHKRTLIIVKRLLLSQFLRLHLDIFLIESHFDYETF